MFLEGFEALRLREREREGDGWRAGPMVNRGSVVLVSRQGHIEMQKKREALREGSTQRTCSLHHYFFFLWLMMLAACFAYIIDATASQTRPTTCHIYVLFYLSKNK